MHQSLVLGQPGEAADAYCCTSRDSCCMWGLGLDCGPILAAQAVADPACLLIRRLPFCWQAAFQLNAGGGWLQGRARWHHLLFHELAK